jgi:GTPase
MDFLPPENHNGNIEYKLKLLHDNDDKFQNRVTQLKYRIDEGMGDAFYHIGVMDNGTILGISIEDYTKSKEILSKMAQQLDACVQVVIEKEISDNRHYGEFLVRENTNGNYIDLKIGVVGNVDSGKSSFTAAITRGIVDDGRGKARLSVFNHKHEIETGRTSSVGHQIVGFDKDGNVVN